ncbi:MAG TPA: B12-binding domain-containing radical SAM protein, partial [Rhodospirillales bacterium]|nr:B12-binding domain-containing radical SAM protein [Rhodospirillales bacterium]
MIKKIAISYPPLENEKGVPLLSQNRQFQWFNNPTYIYPVVPAYAASRLKADGYGVMWDDGIAEELSFNEWWDRIQREKPDLIAMEAKTPTIKRHWKIVEKLKTEGGYVPVVVLYGDHVTGLPEESMESCPVDFVLTGGD